MKKDKRIVRRPWGRRLRGGWIIQPEDILQALKDGEIAEMGKLQVGAQQLRKLITLMKFPEQELLIKTNGCLEVHNIQRFITRRNGHLWTSFRKPRLQHSFRVSDKAWLPETTKPKTTVIIRPRKFA